MGLGSKSLFDFSLCCFHFRCYVLFVVGILWDVLQQVPGMPVILGSFYFLRLVNLPPLRATYPAQKSGFNKASLRAYSGGGGGAWTGGPENPGGLAMIFGMQLQGDGCASSTSAR